MEKGTYNAITDVANVQIGHVTLYEKLNAEDTICTGVTAILPHHQNIFENKVPAASFVLNGFGKTVGLIQVEELGVIESPIMLTNTFSVGAVLEGTLSYMLAENPCIGDSTSSLNIVVGECNDSYLNSMRLLAVRPEHAWSAIKNAKSGAVEQGAIGAGKGMICYGVKGGIGTSSRIATHENTKYTVGVLTLTNFGRRHELKIKNWEKDTLNKPDGSIIIVVATDAPVSDRQLKRLAKRAAIGLGRTATHVHNGSGDIIIAFTNGYTISHESNEMTEDITLLRDSHPMMNQLFEATIEATEEAIYQSLYHAETTVGRKGRIVEAFRRLE
ncbi:P1 family peptidase [Caldibacillus lycopersici]|uniref:P1 family peptidase n=1 Tax=Perspicuibacillus lycopersici TaxID=1325689 RepID=A0AAE3IWF0_9BACI|nr:P1 family peptidase [Perspicuibacillus lycopersici]MCU9614838.1 P1 family peptidase [Perspicuibacillus lycopersici]